MKFSGRLGLGLVFLVCLPTLAFSSTYAPLADFSAAGKNAACQLTSMQKALLDSWTPQPNYFTVPAYPHAVLASAVPSGTTNIQGKAYKTFPSAILLSSEPHTKIIAFYKKSLGRGWFQTEDQGTTYLYRKPQPFSSGEALTQHLLTKPGYIPHIALDTRLGPCDQLLKTGAKTRITVVAAPR